MVTKETEIKAGDRIRIQSYEVLRSLGYSDSDLIYKHCNCVGLVKSVNWIDNDLRHIRVWGTNQVFIDADIAEVLS